MFTVAIVYYLQRPIIQQLGLCRSVGIKNMQRTTNDLLLDIRTMFFGSSKYQKVFRKICGATVETNYVITFTLSLAYNSSPLVHNVLFNRTGKNYVMSQ